MRWLKGININLKKGDNKMGYQIYYSARDVVDLIGDVAKVNNEISDIVNDYLYDSKNKLNRIKDTIKVINKYQSDNEGWREEFYSEYQKHLVFLDKKYPEYDGDSYKPEEVEKDLKEAYKLEDCLNESIEK